MEITIRKPLGYSQIGRKDQQEDAVWPLFADVTSKKRCIVLCDGVGGSEHGEVASQTSSKVIGEYLSEVITKSGYVSEEDVQAAVNLAYDELEKIDTEESKGDTVSMATTLTCVCFHSDGILAAHMGDSRIYHVRPGQGLLYQSADHSLVNALLQAGELTIEEAKVFPRKNVITKAIQPHGNKRFKAEAHQLTDIQAGDYIFLCCDGVLEQLTNERLVEILSLSCSDKDKLALLEAESTGKTKDNYTAYLIPVDHVEGESSIALDDDISVDVVESSFNVVESSVDVQKKQNTPILPSKSHGKNTYIGFLLAAIVLITLGIFSGKLISRKSKQNFDSVKISTKLDSVNKACKGDSLKKTNKENVKNK